MKKTLTLFSGIVFLIAILVAGCKGRTQGSGTTDPDSKDATPLPVETDVIITLDSIHFDEQGNPHLYLNDSKDPNHSGIDSTFITDVYRERLVTWNTRPESGIKILNIKGHSKFIFKADPHQLLNTDDFEMEIPNNVETCIMEEYDIRYRWKEQEFVSDPFLRIPPPSGQ